jgi:cyclic pyranopterin phosphate synthase
MNDFTHLDETGAVHMVDVGGKEPTTRRAVARSELTVLDETRRALFSGDLPKGDALAVARIAAIQATKRTADLIPLCHPIPVDGVEVRIEETDGGVAVTVTVATHGRTGVEMEAMTGAAVGALTLYDMVKGIDRGAVVSQVALVSKSGGRSGSWERG